MVQTVAHTTEGRPERQASVLPFIVFGLLAVALLLVYSLLLMRQMPDPEHRGWFGDMFGAANALFSGLAFSALVYTMILQRKELALQREELALTRAELARQAVAQEQQALTALRAAEIAGQSARMQQAAAEMNVVIQYFQQGDAPALTEARNRILKDPIDRSDASKVASFWHFWGMMVEKDLMPFWVFESSSGERVLQYHARLESYISEIRRTENARYAEFFTRLRDRVLAWKATSSPSSDA